MTDDGLEAAWDDLHAATPPGWFVGTPGQRHGGSWAMYAYDTTERAHIGRRSREWTAVGASKEGASCRDGAVLARDRAGEFPK